MTPIKVKVGERALLARINRALAQHNGQVVRKCRPDTREYPALGDFYATDARVSGVVETHIDLEALAHKMSLLKEFEELGSFDEIKAAADAACLGLVERTITPAHAKPRVRALKLEHARGTEEHKIAAATLNMVDAIERHDKTTVAVNKFFGRPADTNFLITDLSAVGDVPSK